MFEDHHANLYPYSNQSSNTGSLAKARIWLSGAIPSDDEGVSEAQSKSMMDFVRQFARQVFQDDGRIIHGSHPSIVPILLEEVQRYPKDRLILVVSRHWSKQASNNLPLDEWRKTALVYETPDADAIGEQARDESLSILRKWMVTNSDALVALGGRSGQISKAQAGILQEVEFARKRGLPSFILGGFGGAAHDFFEQNLEIFGRLKNGLDLTENRKLWMMEDVAQLAKNICDHLGRLPLIRGQGSDGVSFRILALDGGGLKGAFTAAVLATWEYLTGLKIVDHFDLIAGTSTGGILAIGLALGLTGEEMLTFYQERGSTIFPVTHIGGQFKHWLQHFFRPKYAQETLLEELEKAYYKGKQPITLKDARCRLVIPAYNAISGKSYIFRTPHHPQLIRDADVEAAHAALATSAAPTYFKAAQIATKIAQTSYVDGGVWANSPTMAAVTEAVGFLGIPLDRIDILSVGTTGEVFGIREQQQAGIFGWLENTKILDLLMNAQQESTVKLTQDLVSEGFHSGSEPHFLRVNELTPKGSYSLDSVNKIGDLAARGNSAAKDPENLSQVQSRFLNGVSVPPWKS